MGPETNGVSGSEFGRIAGTEANNGDRRCLEENVRITPMGYLEAGAFAVQINFAASDSSAK